MYRFIRSHTYLSHLTKQSKLMFSKNTMTTLLPKDTEILIRSLDRNGLSQRIKERKAILANMTPDNGNFKALSEEIYLMWNIQREKLWDTVEESILDSTNFIPPNAYDVLLSDVNHELLLGEISERLGISYLTMPTEEEMIHAKNKSIVYGILFGLNYRPMVNLIVSSKRYNKCLNIVFLVDTGCPHLYLCENALIKLGFTENVPKSFDIMFRGVSYAASISPKVLDDGRLGHFHDINLIGSNFLKVARGRLDINYPTNEVAISFL